jgi:amidase
VNRNAGAPRIGLCRTPGWDAADAATQALLERTAGALSKAGATVTEANFAPPFHNIMDHHRRIFNYEASRNYAYEYDRHFDQVSAVLRDTVLTPGRALPTADYIEALEVSEAFRRHFDDVFAGVDLLLTPSAAGEAPAGFTSTGDPRFNSPWTLSWLPCVTLPAGVGPGGLPLGVQLVGPRFGDEALLDGAAWVEKHLN